MCRNFRCPDNMVTLVDIFFYKVIHIRKANFGALCRVINGVIHIIHIKTGRNNVVT